MGGDKEYDKDEILFAYTEPLKEYSGGNVLTTPCIESFFCNKEKERKIDVFYVGKGQNIPRIKETEEIIGNNTSMASK